MTCNANLTAMFRMWCVKLCNN